MNYKDVSQNLVKNYLLHFKSVKIYYTSIHNYNTGVKQFIKRTKVSEAEIRPLSQTRNVVEHSLHRSPS
jgi:hypothetical protein